MPTVAFIDISERSEFLVTEAQNVHLQSTSMMSTFEVSFSYNDSSPKVYALIRFSFALKFASSLIDTDKVESPTVFVVKNYVTICATEALMYESSKIFSFEFRNKRYSSPFLYH